MTGDGGVVKRIVRKGEGEFPLDCPLEDSRVRLHYRQGGGQGWSVQLCCRLGCECACLNGWAAGGDRTVLRRASCASIFDILLPLLRHAG